MQRDIPEALISIAAAAHHLGLNRSTLQRQVRKGAVRSHEGKVILAEVIADRENNLSPGRGGRHAGLSDAETLSGADAMKRPTRAASVASREPRVIDNLVASAVVQLLGQCGPIVAESAVKAGCSMAEAYALASDVQAGLNAIGNEVLRQNGGPGFTSPDDTLTIADELFHEPDWQSLSERAGEVVDFDAWEDFVEARGM